MLDSGAGLYADPDLLDFLGLAESYRPEPDKGLPIGNLTSQLFANVYLDGTDHFAKWQLRVPTWLRYMDDMVLAGDNRGALRAQASAVVEWCAAERGLEVRICGDGPQSTRGAFRFLGACREICGRARCGQIKSDGRGHTAEAQVRVAKRGRVPVAPRDAQIARDAEKAAPTQHTRGAPNLHRTAVPVRKVEHVAVAFGGYARIRARGARVRTGGVPVAAPLPDVSGHVPGAEGAVSAREEAHRRGALRFASFAAIRECGIPLVAPRVHAARVRSVDRPAGGVFPLRLGGQRHPPTLGRLRAESGRAPAAPRFGLPDRYARDRVIRRALELRFPGVGRSVPRLGVVELDEAVARRDEAHEDLQRVQVVEAGFEIGFGIASRLDGSGEQETRGVAVEAVAGGAVFVAGGLDFEREGFEVPPGRLGAAPRLEAVGAQVE